MVYLVIKEKEMMCYIIPLFPVLVFSIMTFNILYHERKDSKRFEVAWRKSTYLQKADFLYDLLNKRSYVEDERTLLQDSTISGLVSHMIIGSLPYIIFEHFEEK